MHCLLHWKLDFNIFLLIWNKDAEMWPSFAGTAVTNCWIIVEVELSLSTSHVLARLNLTHTSSVTQPRQPTLHSYPCYLAWCGSAAPRERHYRTWAATLPGLKWSLGLGGTYIFSLPPQRLSSLSPTHSARPTTKECPSLSFIGDLQLPNIHLWFPHQFLREKGPKLN